MSPNGQPVGLNPSRNLQARLRQIGIVTLLLGLAIAGAIDWIGTHSSKPTEEELLPGNAKAETRQMEILYGKMGLLTVQLTEDLKQPGTQAFLIATVSILISAGCFYFARLTDDDSEAR